MFRCIEYWNTGYLQRKPLFICLDVLNTGIQSSVQSKPIFICLDVLNTGIQDTVQSKPIFKCLDY